MSAAVAIVKPGADPLEAFEARADARAYLWSIGEYNLHEAVDQLQLDAEHTGLVAIIGQDAAQKILADAFKRYEDVNV